MSRKLKIARVGIYLLLWVILTFILVFLYYDFSAPFLPQFIAAFVITSFTAWPAYYSTKVLVPKMLYQKKISRFISFMILISFVNTLLTYLIVGGAYSLLVGTPIFTSSKYILVIASALFIINFIVIGISCAIQIIADRFHIEEQLHVMENEKKNTELSFLRAQVNPHFLFNVLNTIYFQIHMKNNEARSSVEKFSEMLRYQLYDCNTDMIDISKELAYIRNYVSIQQLRKEVGTDLQISIPEDIGSFKIAPLLVLPVIENAFKFISNYKEPSQNKLHISIFTENGNLLVVNVLNTFNPLDISLHPLNSGGLGIKNMKRRLELLYPGQHELTQNFNEGVYETTLKVWYRN